MKVKTCLLLCLIINIISPSSAFLSFFNLNSIKEKVKQHIAGSDGSPGSALQAGLGALGSLGQNGNQLMSSLQQKMGGDKGQMLSNLQQAAGGALQNAGGGEGGIQNALGGFMQQLQGAKRRKRSLDVDHIWEIKDADLDESRRDVKLENTLWDLLKDDVSNRRGAHDAIRRGRRDRKSFERKRQVPSRDVPLHRSADATINEKNLCERLSCTVMIEKMFEEKNNTNGGNGIDSELQLTGITTCWLDILKNGAMPLKQAWDNYYHKNEAAFRKCYNGMQCRILKQSCGILKTYNKLTASSLKTCAEASKMIC